MTQNWRWRNFSQAEVAQSYTWFNKVYKTLSKPVFEFSRLAETYLYQLQTHVNFDIKTPKTFSIMSMYHAIWKFFRPESLASHAEQGFHKFTSRLEDMSIRLSKALHIGRETL